MVHDQAAEAPEVRGFLTQRAQAPLYVIYAAVARFRGMVRRSEAIQNLVGPEPLKPVQRLVERCKLVGFDPAYLLDRTDVLLVQRIDDVADFASLLRQFDAH